MASGPSSTSPFTFSFASDPGPATAAPASRRSTIYSGGDDDDVSDNDSQPHSYPAVAPPSRNAAGAAGSAASAPRRSTPVYSGGDDSDYVSRPDTTDYPTATMRSSAAKTARIAPSDDADSDDDQAPSTVARRPRYPMSAGGQAVAQLPPFDVAPSNSRSSGAASAQPTVPAQPKATASQTPTATAPNVGIMGGLSHRIALRDKKGWITQLDLIINIAQASATGLNNDARMWKIAAIIVFLAVGAVVGVAIMVPISKYIVGATVVVGLGSLWFCTTAESAKSKQADQQIQLKDKAEFAKREIQKKSFRDNLLHGSQFPSKLPVEFSILHKIALTHRELEIDADDDDAANKAQRDQAEALIVMMDKYKTAHAVTPGVSTTINEMVVNQLFATALQTVTTPQPKPAPVARRPQAYSGQGSNVASASASAVSTSASAPADDADTYKPDPAYLAYLKSRPSYSS